MTEPRIAVIGAGIAGLACAAALRDAGIAVEVFEKSRGLGGRIATRRTDGPSFDHGAQYVTARGTAFENYLATAAAAGHAGDWDPAGTFDEQPARRWVGRPGMSALVKPLADGLQINLACRVASLARHAGVWRLVLADGKVAEPFAGVAVTAPAPQARELAGETMAAALAEVRMAPCWAVMAAFEAPLETPFDAVRPDGPPLAWAARNASKPGRDRRPDTWVLHAAPAWSRERLEDDPAAVAPLLLAALEARAGAPLPPVLYAAAHRWRYAMVEAALGKSHLFDGETGLGLAGDWCQGPRVEAAFDSGRALAKAFARALGAAAA